MRESKIGIARKSLSLLDANKSVIDIDDPKTSEEIMLSNWYDTARVSLLSMHTWSFAKKRYLCPKNATDPLFGDYENSYQIPPDYIRTCWFGESREMFEIEHVKDYSKEGDSLLVHYEDTSLPLVYIRDEERTGLFPPYFTIAFVYYLALLMSNEENKNNTDIGTLNTLFKNALKQAKIIDSQEDPMVIIENNKYKSGN